MSVRMAADRPNSHPVDPRRSQIGRYYRWISMFYGFHEGWFEKSLREKALEFLSPSAGEKILEVGCGTGWALREISRRLGPSESPHGLDISLEMVKKSRARFNPPRESPPFLSQSDAGALPYRDAAFDGAYMSGVLELYEDRERMRVLAETRRVLKPDDGRLALAAMKDDGRASGLLRLYERARHFLPRIVPCEAVDAEALAVDVGFTVRRKDHVRLRGLVPIEILLLRP